MKTSIRPFFFLLPLIGALLLSLCPQTGFAARSTDETRLSALEEEAEVLHQARSYEEAIRIRQETVKLAEKLFGPDAPETGKNIYKLALSFKSMGAYAKARPLYQRVLAMTEKALGSNHTVTATALNNLALVCKDLGDYAEAEPLYRRSLEIRETKLGAHHTETATSLNNLAELYVKIGDYRKAEPLYERSLEISETALGPEHPDTAVTLNNLAQLYVELGDYTKAEVLFRRALSNYEEAFGVGHEQTAATLSNLGLLYERKGDYPKAEPLYQRSLKIREIKWGPTHPDTATSLNNLANLYVAMGDYARAEPLHQRALIIFENAGGPNHPSTAVALNNLAHLYVEMGDYAKAEPLFVRAREIFEKVLGLDHPDTANSLSNLARLYNHQGETNKAEQLYLRALAIRDKAFGREHPETAASLESLATFYYRRGDYAKAEPLYQRALSIGEKALGADHPLTAAVLNNLAVVYASMGNYRKAEPLYQRSLRIREKVLGPDHPDTENSLNNLALLYRELGNSGEALSLARRARRAEENTLANILSFTSEQQRLSFRKTTDPYNLAANLGSASDLAEIVLRQKGLVLDSLLEDRLVAVVSKDSDQSATIAQVRAEKRQLLELLLQRPRDSSVEEIAKHQARRKELSERLEKSEAFLAREIAGLGHARRALTVTVNQVQAALKQNEVLIEFLRYNHYLGKNSFEKRYGAIVLASKECPQWLPLSNAASLEKQILLYRKSARGETDEKTLGAVLTALREQIWSPVEKAFPSSTTKVIISPDADLSFVSFATLVGTDDRFVSEKYSIRYVASGRDLLRELKPAGDGNRSIRVFANPDFAAETEAATVDPTATAGALRAMDMRSLGSISFPRLPGTEKESGVLERLANNAGWQIQTSLGAKATESELTNLGSPKILHLATHGFFLSSSETESSAAPGMNPSSEPWYGRLANPMYRSGLAVAGAERTLQAWARGEVPATANDGIVTAEEVGGLKLGGTWLVVLSACDTGSGEAKAGEGVMGLRRGFSQAGAQNLLMTLWPISDEMTVRIVADFYDAALRSADAPQALADTQRDWLVKLRQEKGLLNAIRLAGPFIMSSQGR